MHDVLRTADLLAETNPLAAHYSAFRVSERLLLTGHSHQAWPDLARAAQDGAFQDAAVHLDRKWPRAFDKADAVRRGFARLMQDVEGSYALGPSTHALLVRLLSALELRRRPRLLSSEGEFHSLRRQLARLAEEGVEIVRVPAAPAAAVGARLAAALTPSTAAVLVSAVFYETGQIARGLGDLAGACERAGVPLVVDAYHALDAMPFPLPQLGLSGAFVVGGGYKYCQLGEGNCFLRVPPGCRLRPVVTGWFAEFGALSEAGPGAEIAYADDPGWRFAGATYDPASHYRAAAVFEFFELAGLTPARLRAVSQAQVHLLAERFDALDLDPSAINRDRGVPLTELGGFLTLRSAQAVPLCARLLERGVLADARGTALRLGPAPYLSPGQIRDAVSILGDVARGR